MGRRGAVLFGAVLLFALFAGEAVRNTLSWYGFAVVDGVLAVACVGALVRVRRAPTASALPATLGAAVRDPRLPLAAFVAWCGLTVVWSAYPGGTLLGILILACTTLAAVTIARTLDPLGATLALWWALGAIVVASLAFEAVVAAVGHPVLPVFPIGVVPGERIPLAFYWSRAQLLDGGPIQGILGNANLLAFVALLSLSVTAGLWNRRVLPRGALAIAAVAAALCLVLARSSTGYVAAVVVLLVALTAAALRTSRTRLAGLTLLALLALGAVTAFVLRDRVFSALGRSSDLTGRTDIWGSVWSLFLERPVAGWGWTGYWQPWIPLFSDLAERKGVVYLQAHNALLDAAFQTGVIGALLLGALIVAVAVRAVRTVPVSALPLSLITALVVQSLTESRLLYEGNWVLLVLLALMLPRPQERTAGTSAIPTLDGSAADQRSGDGPDS